jgi:hypothetical protein
MPLSKVYNTSTEVSLPKWTEWAHRIYQNVPHFFDLVRSVIVRTEQEMYQLDRQKVETVHISTLTEDRSLLGRYASGGLLASGIAPLNAVNGSIVRVVWLNRLEERLAEGTPETLPEALEEWFRHTKEMTGYGLSWKQRRESSSLVALQRKLSLERTLPLVTNSMVRVKLENLLRKANNIVAKDTLTSPKHEEISSVDIQLGKVPVYIENSLNRILTTKNYSQFAFMKPFIDPHNQMNNSVYAEFIANQVRRYEKSLYKHNLTGPLMHLNAPGSTLEPISQSYTESTEIETAIKNALKKWQDAEVITSPDVYLTKLNQTDISMIMDSGNKWVDRTTEIKTIHEKLEQMDPNKGLLILTSLNYTTDAAALEKAKDLGITTLVLLTLQELDTVVLPDSFGGNQKYFIFRTPHERQAFIDKSTKV